MGRAARHEYGESIAPDVADSRTMGMTCLFQAREHDTPQPFEPPSWARRYESASELPYGASALNWWRMGYWWIELGCPPEECYPRLLRASSRLEALVSWWA